MRRIPELDALRGIAAFAILLYHLRPDRLCGGWAAVDLFFVLSGYLITEILLLHGDGRSFLPTFYLRRALRIWPIYYLAFFGLTAFLLVSRGPADWGVWPLSALYLQNVEAYVFRQPRAFSPLFRHTWSLAIEEQFYLLWPAAVLLAGRRRLLGLCLATATVSVAARAMGFDWWITLTRCDGFALGGMLAWMLSREVPDSEEAGPSIAVAAACVLAPLAYLAAGCLRFGSRDFLLPPWGPKAGWLTILAINVACFGLLALVLRYRAAPITAWLRLEPLVALGRISYGIYLFHIFVFAAIDGLFPSVHGPMRLFLVLAKLVGTVAIASASWHWMERPILRWKDRWSYSAKAATAIVAAPHVATPEPMTVA